MTSSLTSTMIIFQWMKSNSDAHALALDLTLVTANDREFPRVPGLRVENWLK